MVRKVATESVTLAGAICKLIQKDAQLAIEIAEETKK